MDLGLPSGLLWRSLNVGANHPNEVGLYFTWGDTTGHEASSEYNYTQEVYDETSAASIRADLTLAQDMARANLGEPYRMPSYVELQELYEHCEVKFAMRFGVPGVLFTSHHNGKELFFVNGGVGNGSSIINPQDLCIYWTTTYYSSTNAHSLWAYDGIIDIHHTNRRWYGCLVRPVKDPDANRSDDSTVG